MSVSFATRGSETARVSLPTLSCNDAQSLSVLCYSLMDDLGSVLKVVDSSGTVKNSYSYDPYGNSLNKSVNSRAMKKSSIQETRTSLVLGTFRSVPTRSSAPDDNLRSSTPG